MWNRFGASQQAAQEGLVIFHRFAAKYFKVDWDLRIVAAAAMYIVTKYRRPVKSRYYTDYLYEKLIKDFHIDTKAMSK